MFCYGQDELTTSKVLRILSGDLKTRLTPKTREKIITSAQIVENISLEKRRVYGVNTGVGILCNTIISAEQIKELQINILRSHAVGVGELVPKDISKIMMILKVHMLAKGFSGVSIEVIDRILWHIENDIIPVVPSQGSLGASGDIAPLAHLFLPLIGEGKVFYKNTIVNVCDVLKTYDISPIELTAKDGLSLINGTQFMLAHAILILDKLHNCLSHADIIAALMIEGLMGSANPFNDAFHQLRPYKGVQHVAMRMYKFIEGSKIIKSHKDCNKVQDPYSLRCIPQVHGASRHSWLHLKEIIEVELNSVTDNPIIISDEMIVSGGHFHGQPLALPLDYACMAASELGSISERRTYLSMEGKTENTPQFLIKDVGLCSGYMLLQYTAAALVSENKSMCFPSSVDSIPSSLGQEDHVSMGAISGRKALTVCENLKKILAIELLCAAQAMDYRKPLKSSDTLDTIHHYIRSHVAHVTQDKIFTEDIEKAISMITNKTLLPFTHNIKTEYDELFEVY